MKSPYCKIYLGGQYQRSSTCQSGGKNPSWSDSFFITIPFNSDPMLQVEIWDDDAVNDDMIGSGSYNLAQYLAQRMNTTGN
jgi:Ca2+-dependent lipid-binding protein